MSVTQIKRDPKIMGMELWSSVYQQSMMLESNSALAKDRADRAIKNFMEAYKEVDKDA